MNDDPQLIEALLNDYLLKYGKQIPQDVLDIPNPKDRLHAIEEFIQNNLEIKLVSREELVKNYLENKNPKEIAEESFAKQRLEFIKKLLRFKTSSPILELPDSVDKLVALGLTQDQAYDLIIENFSQELGITRAVLPKYYEAIQTINKYAKDKKLEIVLGKDVLEALKIRAVVLRATWTEKAEVFEPVATAFTNNEEVWRESISFDYKKFYTGGELSVQEMFDNPLFSIVSNYGKGKFKDAAWNKLAGTKIGQSLIEKLGINAATKTAVTAATTTTTTATGTAAASAAAGTAVTPVVGTIIGFVAGIILPRIQDALSWTKRNFKKVAIPIAGVLGYGIFGTTGALVTTASSFFLFYPSEILTPVGKVVSFVFNSLPSLVTTEIVWPIVAIITATPIVIALILFIITNSALVVPYDANSFPFGYNSFLPGVSFDCKDSGNRIVASGATEKLLPDDVESRKKGLCISPTEIVIHWSGGWNGVMGTYNEFASAKNKSCQFATDENTTLQMLQMWEKKVEFSWCAGSHNDFAVNIEMSGLCFSEMPGTCGGINTPPPESEIEKTVSLVCWLKKQYNINTVIGHYEIAGSGKSDPGSAFLHNTLLPRVNRACP